MPRRFFLFCPSCCHFCVTFENVGFSVKLCKLGEFPLGVEVCYCFRSVRGGSEHMSVVITFKIFIIKKLENLGGLYILYHSFPG